jgi:hypothetical protein
VIRYGARVLDDPRHDPYAPKAKRAGSLQCTQCGAVFAKGRWRWAATSPTAVPATCPACRRIGEHAPAGWVTLDGPAVAAHGDELLRIALNEAEHERGEHPMHRIIDAQRSGDRVEIATTDIHLPQRIGRALARAHHGTLDIRYGRDEYSVRVRWHG